jgi:hypothetical protein
MFLAFFIFFTISFVVQIFTCLFWPLIIELIGSFIYYPKENYIDETIFLILFVIYAIIQFAVIIFEILYIIRRFITIVKFRKREKEKEMKIPMKMKKFFILLFFIICGFIFHIITYFIIHMAWKHYANCNEKFGVDLKCLFIRNAFIGPIRHNVTSIQPISAPAVTVWVLHLIAIIIIIISFILLIVSAVWFGYVFYKYYKTYIKKLKNQIEELEEEGGNALYKEEKEKKEKEEEEEEKKFENFGNSVDYNPDIMMPNVPDHKESIEQPTPVQENNLESFDVLKKGKGNIVIPLLPLENIVSSSKPIINPEFQQHVRETQIEPNTD